MENIIIYSIVNFVCTFIAANVGFSIGQKKGWERGVLFALEATRKKPPLKKSPPLEERRAQGLEDLLNGVDLESPAQKNGVMGKLSNAEELGFLPRRVAQGRLPRQEAGESVPIQLRLRRIRVEQRLAVCQRQEARQFHELAQKEAESVAERLTTRSLQHKATQEKRSVDSIVRNKK